MRKGLSVLRLFMLGSMLVSGGVGAAFYTGAVQVPDASLADIGSWGAATDERVEIITSIDVSNPNNIAIDLQPVSVAYRLYMNDVKLAHGSKQGEPIPPGNMTVDITTNALQSNMVDWWISHIRNDEVTDVTAEAAVDLEAGPVSHSIDGIEYTHEIKTEILPMLEDALSGMEGTYTYSATGIEAIDPKIEIRGITAEWGRITEKHTELRLTVDVHNPNAYPLPTPEFVGQLHLNGVPLASWDANDVDVLRAPANGVIAPTTTEEIVLGVSIDHKYVDDWLTSHIKQNEYTEGELKARMAFSIEGKRFYIPRRGNLHCEFRFWTGILEEQEQRMENDGCEFRNVGLFDRSANNGSEDGTSGSTDSESGSTDNNNDESQDEQNDGVLDGVSGL